MSDAHLPAKRDDDALVFDHRANAPLVRRGHDHLALLRERRNTALVNDAESGPVLLWSFKGYGRKPADAQDLPDALPVIPQNIPHELTERRQWVCWDWARFRDEWHILPISPVTAGSVDVWDSSTWTGLPEALDFAAAKDMPGIGIILTDGDPYTGLVLKSCREAQTGQLEPVASRIVAYLDSYAEATPDGQGVQVLVRGTLPYEYSDIRSGRSEAFDRGRVFPVTAHHLPGTPLIAKNRQDILDKILMNKGNYISDSHRDDGMSSVEIVTLTPRSVIIGSCLGQIYAMNLANGKKRWVAQCEDSLYSHSSIGGDTIYFVTMSGHVCAINDFDGTIKWKLSISPFTIDTPEFTNETVVVHGVDRDKNIIHSIDNSNGEEIWRFNHSERRFITNGHQIHRGAIYFDEAEGILGALDLRTGSRLWRFSHQGVLGSWDFQVASDEIVSVVSNGILFGLDAKNGTEIYRRPALTKARFLKLRSANVLAYTDERSRGIRATDPTTGRERWHRQDTWMFRPVESSGVLYAASGRDDHELAAVDLSTGEDRWRIKHYDHLLALSAVGDLIYVVDRAQIFAVDALSGEFRWYFGITDRNYLALHEGVMYLRGGDGWLYALDSETGTPHWCLPVPDAADRLDLDWDTEHWKRERASATRPKAPRRKDAFDSGDPWTVEIAGGMLYLATNHSVYAIRQPSRR